MSFYLFGDWQNEGVEFLKYKICCAVLNCRENWALYSFAAANHEHIYSSDRDVTQAFTYHKLDDP